jgi:hypothetical protein
VEEWLDALAEALDVPRIEPKEMGAVLKLAREVAHGVERKLAPASTFLAGLYVGRGSAEGVAPNRALDHVLEVARSLMPGGSGT